MQILRNLFSDHLKSILTSPINKNCVIFTVNVFHDSLTHTAEK